MSVAEQKTPNRTPKERTPLALIQLTIVGLLVGGLFLAPRSGEQVTLYPIGKSAAQTMPQILSQPGLQIVGRGTVPGSYVVTGQRPGFSDLLLDHNILVLAASRAGCVSEPV